MKEQITGQITLYDIFTQDVPLGSCEAEHKGSMIKFQELENYIGKRVVIARPTSSHEFYSVVMITSYYKNSDRIYKLNPREIKTNGKEYPERINEFLYDINHRGSDDYVVDHICDRIGYTDDNKRFKEHLWVSEQYCSNGRWEPLDSYPECFYEYIA